MTKKSSENLVFAENAATEASAKRTFGQFIKFGIVGVSNTLVDMIVQVILTHVIMLFTSGNWITYFAKTVGYGCGILNSYILNSRWTFKEERQQNAKEIFRFILVNLLVLLISIGLTALFADVMHLDKWWESLQMPAIIKKIIVGRLFCSLLATVICIFVNFVLNKLFVFKGKKQQDTAKQN